MKILLVEDDKSILEIMSMYLCGPDQNRDCSRARTVDEALKALEKDSFDLIMLDILLEGVLSTPVIEEVQKIASDIRPEICIFSGAAISKKIAEQYSVYGFLPKPFNLDDLDKLLESLDKIKTNKIA